MVFRRSFLVGLAALGLAAASAPAAQAQAWPARPITIIVPWGAGGGTDAHMRLLASMLEKDLGVAVNVVNQTGGNGVTGHSAIANAAPDGYTFGAVTAEITMMHHTGLTKLTWRDYTPVSVLNRTEAGFIVAKNNPWKDLQTALAAIKANPGKFKASGTAQGGIWHIAVAGLLMEAGQDVKNVNWIPSQGAARAMQELLAGGVDIVTASPGEAVAMLDAGEARALAVMGPERNPRFKDVATVKEQGVNWEMTSFITLQGPKGVDPAIVRRLDELVKKALSSRDWQSFASSRGFTINYGGPAELQAMQERLDKYMGVVMGALGLRQG
ncbi:MAG: tripartite tricarboxylate transporter substrate binding protein [Beijerinckiaceae bacterium]|jgi:tripartite-type tricarboxylate transporter receptor subunit TctC|nr:tripartite tricarboxylate transporter substrate binding protein [Beijerinckiaceae bacterium]